MRTILLDLFVPKKTCLSSLGNVTRIGKTRCINLQQMSVCDWLDQPILVQIFMGFFNFTRMQLRDSYLNLHSSKALMEGIG